MMITAGFFNKLLVAARLGEIDGADKCDRYQNS
jgi:hypothetical protein